MLLGPHLCSWKAVNMIGGECVLIGDIVYFLGDQKKTLKEKKTLF